MTSRQLAHIEAAANTIIGSLIGQIALWAYGLPLMHALSLNATLIALSYVRSYVIRRLFHGVVK